MEQNENASFLDKNRNYLIAGIIVAVAVVVYFAVSRKTPESEQTQNAAEQSAMENTNQNASQDENQNPPPSTNQNQTTLPSSPQSQPIEGNKINAVGTLRGSDDLNRGNLMVETSSGKIYVQTKRDFSSKIGKEVILSATGSMKSFVFLGFAETTKDSETSAIGGSNETAGAIAILGKLQKTDDETRGNYEIITGDDLKVYLQTAHDYSAWIGSEINLSAQGTIKSFTNAQLTKK